MFSVRDSDGASNSFSIVGAFRANSNVDISQLIFENYDADARRKYAVAAIGVRDHYGDATSNGLGDFVVKTRGSEPMSERLRVQHDGRVGIGKIPLSKLDVAGNAVASNVSSLGESIGESFLAGSRASASFAWKNDASTGIGMSPDGAIAFYGMGAERMRVAPDGRIGIGTSNPSRALEVIGDLNFSGSLRRNGEIFEASSGAADPWTSNAAHWTSNAAHALSNSASWTSNGASWASNAIAEAFAAVAGVAAASNEAARASAIAASSADRASYASAAAANADPDYSYESNAIAWASNVSIGNAQAISFAIDYASNASDGSSWASAAIASASNAIAYSIALASNASEAASRASNASTDASMISAWTSNLAAAALSRLEAAVEASNLSATAPKDSNSSIELARSTFSSNAARFASNASIVDSNAAIAGSNRAGFASNAISFASRAGEWASNGFAGDYSKGAFASNSAAWASDASTFASNATFGSSNAADWIDRAIALASNSIVFSGLASASACNASSAVLSSPASNQATFASNTGFALSNEVESASEKAVGASNVSAWASNAGVAESNRSSYASAAGAWASNASAWASNSDAWASNAAAWASNVAYFDANASVWASNTSAFASNVSYYDSNESSKSSNDSIVASNAGEFGSNAGTWASNAGAWGSNAGTWGSNAGAWGSNASAFGSNASRFSSNAGASASNSSASASNAHVFSSAKSTWSSNASGWGSNAAAFGSNSVFWASNASVAASNASVTASNAAAWASNAGFWGSNAVAFASNSIPSLSNANVFASNVATWASNASETTSNSASWASNSASWASNANAFASNSIAAASNAVAWTSNVASSIGEISASASNAAIYASNASSSAGASSLDATDSAYIAPLSNVVVLSNVRLAIDVLNAEWLASVDSTAADFGFAVACDAQGNAYLGGYYGTTVAQIYNASNVYSGSNLRATSTGISGYCVKYNSNGSLSWFVSIDGLGSERIESIAVDYNLNLYVAGRYGVASATIYNASNTSSGSSLREASTTSGGFLVKYNSNGAMRWFASIDGASIDEARGIAVDASENVYVSGFYTTAATIYNNSNTSSGLILRASSNGAAFLIKYNSNGAAQWFTSIDARGADQGLAVAVDSNMNVYAGGYYTSSNCVIYNSNNAASALTLPTTSNTAAFAVKYNSNGFAQWAVAIDGGSNEQAISIAVDSNANVFVGGTYQSSNVVVYNAGGSVSSLSFVTASNSTIAAYLVKFDSNGVAQWDVCVDGSAADYAMSVAVDASGCAYLSGYYASNATVYDKNGSNYGLTLVVPSNIGAFVLKADSNGFPLCAICADGFSAEYSDSVAVDASGNVFFGGYYGPSNPTFYDAKSSSNVSSAISLRATSNSGVFLAKYAPPVGDVYRLRSTLGTEDTGFAKYVINDNATENARIWIRDSNDSATLRSVQIASNSMVSMIWYGGAWFDENGAP